jgi:hypothetical protein
MQGQQWFWVLISLVNFLSSNESSVMTIFAQCYQVLVVYGLEQGPEQVASSKADCIT